MARLYALSSSHKNLMLIAGARIVLWVIAVLLIIINQLWLHLPFSELQVHCMLTAFLLSAIVAIIQARTAQHIGQQTLFQHLMFDVIIMAGLFHFVGGAANPFVSILLFPLTISAAILPSRLTWLMVLLTLCSYGSLFLIAGDSSNLVVDHSQHTHVHGNQQSVFSLHLVGMWFNFAVSAVLISFFVVRMRQQIQLQQQKLNAHREKSLRDEQLLGIATQAASAAHHISTPLATMAVIINDLQRAKTHRISQEDLSVLRAQLDNCSQVLSTLRQRKSTNASVSLTYFINQLVDEFKLMRPDAVLDVSKGNLNFFTIGSDPALRMALLNILNNAADVSPKQIQLDISFEKETLHIKIRDYGSGFPENFEDNVFIDKIEVPIASTKPNGMGIGLFLSHATIEQHKGTISIKGMKQGTLTHITLPLDIDNPRPSAIGV